MDQQPHSGASAETQSVLAALFDFLTLGGPVVGLLMAISIAAVTVIGVKLIRFWPILAGSDARLDRAIDGARGGNVTALDRITRPAARIALYTLQVDRGADASVARERVEDRAMGEISDMRRHLRLLEIISQVAPLLGLLGTILGMIEAFKVIETSSGAIDPAALAGGIWVALLTTAVGLAVAIPASVALQWLDGIVANEQRQIERVATAILTGAPLDASGTGQWTPAAPGALTHAHR